MNERLKTVLKVIGIIAAVGALLIVGAVAVSVPMFRTVTQVESEGPYYYGTDSGAGTDGGYRSKLGAPDMADEYSESSAGGAPDALLSAPVDPAAPPTGEKIIKNAWVDMRVDSVEDAVAEVRTLAKRFDADITELFLSAGDDGPVRPMEARGPAHANVTLRVPADRLDAIVDELPALGEVLNQNASSSDVTVQFIDLSARLKNLKAEEDRLREFLERAEKIDDLLAVQRELSRVRGEVEAMQAQVDHIEREAARSTLTISMSEPGPIVRPGGNDWGFREALTRGLQGAVGIITGLITSVIAVSPVLLMLALIWFVVRAVRRRRRNRDGASAVDGTGEATDDNEVIG